MAVKYFCPKCEKRYIDWGAEKLKYACPDCDGEKLIEVGRPDGAPATKRPTLKRKKKKAAAPPPPPTAAAFQEDMAAPDLSVITGETVAEVADFGDPPPDEEAAFDDDEAVDLEVGAEEAEDED